jgi:hypothetical protein
MKVVPSALNANPEHGPVATGVYAFGAWMARWWERLNPLRWPRAQGQKEGRLRAWESRTAESMETRRV